jgi:hypothetical protein
VEGGKMSDPEKQSQIETKRKEKRIAEEAKSLGKEQERRKAYLVREQAIEKASKVKETERAEKRATEEIAQLSADQARKKALVAREKKIADAQEDRKLKTRKQLTE